MFFSKRKQPKGFTLIELLVVVAIIGLLTSVVFASLNDARKKSKDAFLRKEALQLQILLEQEYQDTGSYLALNNNSAWITDASGCGGQGSAANFTGNYATEAIEICKAIVDKASTTWSFPFKLGVSIDIPDKPNKYSFMIALPYKNTLLCMGSSGAVSDTTSTGVGGWIQPGCHGNP